MAQDLGAPCDGVLIDIRQNGVAGGPLDRLGRREVRKTLGEVDRAVLVGKTSHLADDRFGEPRGLLRGAGTRHGLSIRGPPADSPRALLRRGFSRSGRLRRRLLGGRFRRGGLRRGGFLNRVFRAGDPGRGNGKGSCGLVEDSIILSRAQDAFYVVLSFRKWNIVDEFLHVQPRSIRAPPNDTAVAGVVRRQGGGQA